ncbi:alpha/beta hydrolase [Bombella sp. ESL0385]|uniref:alpha/beta hydrolase n=1 Tax=Bombella sp. ESL0385 TaxID=2676446 RepID=UPI0012D87CED|nr:alpha/beta hydrolase [Bombella sp. ESL0385]MUG90937.1 alpha/beta hydrolase [Bombella sp. ESL0385]
MPEVMFAGPDGRLEGHYHHSEDPNAPLALVIHPHPLHGGTMNNRITYTMYRRFQMMGFSVLRYNSRGVGRSQGRYDGGIGEISDAAAALDWMQMINPNSSELWIAGYSFGAFVGMQLLMRRPEIRGWISVAPPADDYDFNFLAPCPCSGLMIAGGRDNMAPEPVIRKLVEKLNTQKNVTVDYRLFPEADHIFSQQAELIADALEDHVTTRQRNLFAPEPASIAAPALEHDAEPEHEAEAIG